MNSLNFKRKLGSLWPASRKSRKVVLLYHSVAGGSMSTPKQHFSEQMKWLKAHADVVSLDQLLNGVTENKLSVAITFDDGYKTLHSVVAPVLEEHGFTATVYLNSGEILHEGNKASDARIGHYPDELFMNWEEVTSLVEKGWTIGSHGVHHIDLSLAQADEVFRQLQESKSEISKRTGRTCEHFAYTWGHYNLEVKHAVEVAKYHWAASCVHGSVEPGIDRFAFPRLDVRPEYELSDFVDMVTGRWDYMGLIQRLKAI